MDKCKCQCRHMQRSIEVSYKKYIFTGTSDGSDRLYRYNGIYYFDRSDLKKEDHDKWLSETLSDEGVRRVSQLFLECICCERHKENKPVVFIEPVPVVKKISAFFDSMNLGINN